MTHIVEQQADLVWVPNITNNWIKLNKLALYNRLFSWLFPGVIFSWLFFKILCMSLQDVCIFNTSNPLPIMIQVDIHYSLSRVAGVLAVSRAVSGAVSEPLLAFSAAFLSF